MKTETARNAGLTACAASMLMAADAFAATGGGEDGSGLVIWGFIGFCAVILVGQLLPAIIHFFTARKLLERRIQDELADKGKLERVHAVLDRE